MQFRPEPALMMASSDERARSRVRRARMRGTVCAVEGAEARVCFEGELEMIHPGLRPDKAPPAPSDQNMVKLSVAGWLECDRAARRVARFSLATRSAVYAATSGGEVHYEGVAYLLDTKR